MSTSPQNSMRRSLRGSNKFNISSELQNSSQLTTAMEEDFELAIKAIHVTKQKIIDDVENIPFIDNVSKMEVELTEQEQVAEIEESSDTADECNNNEEKLNLEQALEVNPYAVIHGYGNKDEFKAQSDGDSAFGSCDSEILHTNYRDDLAKMGLRPGVVVWAKSGQEWWPGIMQEIESEAVAKNTIYVKYFNYRGLKGIISMKNAFPFMSKEENWMELKENRKILKKSFEKLSSQSVARAEKEAEIFMTFEEKDRLEILKIIVKLQTGPRCRQTIKVDIKASKAVPSHLVNSLQKYIDEIKIFDDHFEKIENERKEKQMAMKTLNAESKLSTSSKESSVERVPVRQSGRERIIKRKFSISFVESTPTDTLPPPSKKQRRASTVSIDKNIPLEERFKFCPKDISTMFKNAQTETICMECCTLETEDLKVYKCKKCPYSYHEKCGHHSEVSIRTFSHTTGDTEMVIKKRIVNLTCKPCSSEDKYCFSCQAEVATDEKFICKNSDCKQIYHKSCLKMSPNFNENSGICPLHSCHTCKWKLTNRNGSIVKCMKCPVAYHSDIYCLPAGTQVISKDEILCPRHKTRDEEKLKPLNIDFCNNCTHSGEVICCDTCPISVHKACIPEDSRSDPNSEKFICDDCHNGSMPLYNTVVWAKVGTYRWWPCYILTPQKSTTKGCRTSDRQFCVVFFGTYEYYWLTHERVFGYHLQGGGSKSKAHKKNIDGKFAKAIEEADKIHKMIDDNIEDDTSTKPKPFRRILQNQPIYPVKLKKDVDKDEKCSCKPDDPSPCGYNSGCIVRITNYECNKSCPAGDKCQNQKLRKRDYDFIKLRKTKDRGYGAFAKKDIPDNTVVSEYVGDLINRQEFERRAAAKQARGDREYYFMTYDTDLFVDAEPTGNLSRFINHSCDPNCKIIKITVDGNTRLGIYSNCNIPTGTELTFDYMFEMNEKYGKVRCLCGTSKCTGFIGGVLKGKEQDELKQNRQILKLKKKKNKGAKSRISTTTVKVPSTPISEVSGTDPLEMMMVSLDVPPEDEVTTIE